MLTMLKDALRIKIFLLALLLLFLNACMRSSMHDTFHDPNMDFAAVKTIAVMPFDNLTTDQKAAERVRDTFTNILLSTGEIYVVPSGEVTRGVLRAGVANAVNPSSEEIVKLASIIKVDAVVTGTLREYGQVRSGTTTANIVSFSLQMIEAQTGKIIWTAAATKGGISMNDRLFGGGGTPMNDITEEAVNDIINKYFR